MAFFAGSEIGVEFYLAVMKRFEFFLVEVPFPALASRMGSPTLQREVDLQLARVVLERDDVLEVVEGELRGDGGSMTDAQG